jgi:hypothetical protein
MPRRDEIGAAKTRTWLDRLWTRFPGFNHPQAGQSERSARIKKPRLCF